MAFTIVLDKTDIHRMDQIVGILSFCILHMNKSHIIDRILNELSL